MQTRPPQATAWRRGFAYRQGKEYTKMAVSDAKDGLHISMTRKMISATHSANGNTTIRKATAIENSGTTNKMAN